MQAQQTSDANAAGKRRHERTCAACRRKAPIGEMLRLVLAPDGELVIDPRGNLPGRGAHLCACSACLTAAVSRRSLDRVFGEKVRYPAPGALVGAAEAAVMRRIGTLLCSCNGARALQLGTDAAIGAVSAGRAACVLVARDSSAAGAVAGAAGAAGVPVRALATKERIGRMLDRRPTGVVAVTDTRLAAALSQAADRLEDLI